YGAVVVEAVGILGIATNHVSRLRTHPGNRLVNTATGPGYFGAGYANKPLLGVVHHHHAGHDPLADHRPGGNRAVGVEQFDPVVVFHTDLFGVVFAQPHNRATAGQSQHQQVVAVGAVDAPLLVRRDPVQRFFGVTVAALVDHAAHGLGVDGRTVHQQALTKGTHPLLVLVALLTTGQVAPGDPFVDVGVSGVVGHVLVFQARPGRAGDDLARLRHNVPEADFFLFLVGGQMGVIQAGELGQRRPGFYRHLAVGFRRQGQDDLGGINGTLNLRAACVGTLKVGIVQVLQEVHFLLGVPVDALTTVTQLVHQRTKGGKAGIGVRIVPLHGDEVGCGLARNQVAFAFFPVLHIERLAK